MLSISPISIILSYFFIIMYIYRECIYRIHLVDIHRIRHMVQFPGTLSKYASGYSICVLQFHRTRWYIGWVAHLAVRQDGSSKYHLLHKWHAAGTAQDIPKATYTDMKYIDSIQNTMVTVKSTMVSHVITMIHLFY